MIFQAGDSEQGRDLGAATADVVFTHAASIEQGQAFYRDIKGRAARLGRDPEQLLVLPGRKFMWAIPTSMPVKLSVTITRPTTASNWR